MSYRRDALTAFDAMGRDEWQWFKPRGRRTRDEWRALIETGRVDCRLVLRHLHLASRIVEHQASIRDLSTEMDAWPIAVKCKRSGPALQVVA